MNRAYENPFGGEPVGNQAAVPAAPRPVYAGYNFFGVAVQVPEFREAQAPAPAPETDCYPGN